jgi:hypothetical protein
MLDVFPERYGHDARHQNDASLPLSSCIDLLEGKHRTNALVIPPFPAVRRDALRPPYIVSSITLLCCILTY